MLSVSITLQTGGLESGEISTKSNVSFCAISRAASIETTPTCAPSAAISLTSEDVISSFRRARLLSFLISITPYSLQVHDCVFLYHFERAKQPLQLSYFPSLHRRVFALLQCRFQSLYHQQREDMEPVAWNDREF